MPRMFIRIASSLLRDLGTCASARATEARPRIGPAGDRRQSWRLARTTEGAGRRERSAAVVPRRFRYRARPGSTVPRESSQGCASEWVPAYLTAFTSRRVPVEALDDVFMAFRSYVH